MLNNIEFFGGLINTGLKKMKRAAKLHDRVAIVPASRSINRGTIDAAVDRTGEGVPSKK